MLNLTCSTNADVDGGLQLQLEKDESCSTDKTELDEDQLSVDSDKTSPLVLPHLGSFPTQQLMQLRMPVSFD